MRPLCLCFSPADINIPSPGPNKIIFHIPPLHKLSGLPERTIGGFCACLRVIGVFWGMFLRIERFFDVYFYHTGVVFRKHRKIAGYFVIYSPIM